MGEVQMSMTILKLRRNPRYHNYCFLFGQEVKQVYFTSYSQGE